MTIFLAVLGAIVIFFIAAVLTWVAGDDSAPAAKSLEERENKLREAKIFFEGERQNYLRLLLAEEQVALVASKQSKDKEVLAPVEKIKRRPRKSKK